MKIIIDIDNNVHPADKTWLLGQAIEKIKIAARDHNEMSGLLELESETRGSWILIENEAVKARSDNEKR